MALIQILIGRCSFFANQTAERAAAKFDVDAIQKGRADDPLLQSGDIVIAGSSAIKAGYNAILKALPVAGLFAFL